MLDLGDSLVSGGARDRGRSANKLLDPAAEPLGSLLARVGDDRIPSGANSMRVTLFKSDGTEQTVDVAKMRIKVGPVPLELEADDLPMRIVVQSPGHDRNWGRFVVHHSAANVMILELVSGRRLKKRTPKGLKK